MRPIDADAYRAIYDQKCARDCGMCGFYDSECMCHLIDEAPTIDVTLVVPCKDCRHCTGKADYDGQELFCAIWGRGWHRVQPNDFCSYGER